jgi:protein TIF31
VTRQARGDGGHPSPSSDLAVWDCPIGFLKEGCELINEALNLFNNVYGAMHVEICACLRLLARLHYIMGDYAEVGEQERPTVSQRPLGLMWASEGLGTALSPLH